MESKIEKLVRFASDYFKISEERIYGHITTDDCSIARYFIWHYLHYQNDTPTSVIGKAFCREKRTIFYGISKIKNSINMQMHYRNMYGMFVQEYEKWLGS